jgi:hypothetical protein
MGWALQELLEREEKMEDLSSFSIFVFCALFLSAMVKFIPLMKDWGDRSAQIWQIIISLASFFGYILVRIYISEQMAQILFGLGIFVLFFGCILFQVWKFANKQDENPIKKNLGAMITPVVNFLVIFSEVFLLIYIASNAGLL